MQRGARVRGPSRTARRRGRSCYLSDMATPTLIEVTDRSGSVLEPTWLARAEAVHRQLRPQLPKDYLDKMHRVFAGGGRLIVAVDEENVRGVAVWRMFENTFVGRFLYVDDLVTDETQRSRGIGAALLGHCEHIARELGCETIGLDSGVQRGAAHRFYFREGYIIKSFNFGKGLT